MQLLYVVSSFVCHSSDSFNLCQIWNLQSWHCLRSLSVPAYIIQRGNQYIPTMNIEQGRRLSTLSHISSNDECLVLSYEGLCGLLMLKNDDLKLWYGINALQNNFYPFPSFLGDILDINISSNQQLLSVITKEVS